MGLVTLFLIFLRKKNHAYSEQAQRAEEMTLGTYITNEGIITASILHKYSTEIKITIIEFEGIKNSLKDQ